MTPPAPPPRAPHPLGPDDASPPTGDKPTGDNPTGDNPTGDKPTGDKPTGDKPTGDKPTGDKPTGDKLTGDKPTGDKLPGDKLMGARSVPNAEPQVASTAHTKASAPAARPGSLREVRVITFDADDTLWDFDTAMRAALHRVIDTLRGTHPDVAARWTVDALAARRDAIAEVHRGRLTITEMRDRSFVEALAADGVVDAELAWTLREVYFHHRHGDVQLFDDVHPAFAALDALAGSTGRPFVYGLVTNGNTDPERSGLPGRFSFTVYADEVGVAKPDPAIYRLATATAADLTGCAPHQVLHVGDSHANDIVPAAMLGLPTVLIDRSTPRAAEAGAVGGGNSRTPAVTHDDNPGHETNETNETNETEETDRPSRSAPLATIRQLTELAHLLSR